MKLHRGMIRLVAALTAIASLLVCSATALAWRRPTSRERIAITRVAERAPHAGSAKIRVSRIHVSTVGPWASAGLTLRVGHELDGAMAIFHKVKGTWRLTRHSPGTAGIQCGINMPRKDQRNLGFSRCTPGSS